MATESPAALQPTGGTLSIQQCQTGLTESFKRMTIRTALDPELIRSLKHHDDPVLNLEALILQASREVMYSSVLNAMRLFDLAAASPPEVWSHIRTHFAWLAKHGLAHALDEIGRPADSMAAAIEASTFATQAGRAQLAAMSRSMFGQALSRRGYSANAARTLAEASEESLVDDKIRTPSKYYLARIYEREGDIESAIRVLMKLAESPEGHLAIDGYHVGLARLLAKVGRINDAESALAAGREILRRRGEPTKLRSQYLLADAQIRIAKVDFAQAARRAEWSRAGFERGGFVILADEARLLLAGAHLGLGDPSSAIATLAEVEPLTSGPFKQLEIAQILAECYSALGDHSNEVRQLRETARLSEQLRSSAHAAAQMERLVAERADEELRTLVVEIERDELKVRHLHNNEAISMICHDLRGSLNIVTLAAESMARSTTDSRPKEQLFDSVKSMDRILTQLNSVTELDQTMRQLASEMVDVNKVCRSLVARILPLASTCNMTLSAHEHGRECTVDGDTTAVERILANFITNAIDHCPSGSTINVRVAPATPPFVRITVVDDGPGIEGDDLETIFHKFVSSVDRSTSASTGLGLYIARQLANSMGGEVGVEPGDGGIGCSFWLELPCSTSG